MKNGENRHAIIPFSLRFIAVHTLTYAIFGILFMVLSNYFDYFQSDPLFHQVMKTSDALSVRLAIPAQILRGALLAFAIYPFREVIIGMEWGSICPR